MNQLLDFLAIIAFVVVYFTTKDIFLATAVLMGGVTLQVIIYWAMKKPIGNELKITFWASMVLGSMTLIFRDESFIQWKPTIVYWVLACSLVFSQLFTHQNLLQRMLGKQLTLPARIWTHLNYGWAAGFAFAGVLNLVVAYEFSMEVWVSYKLIGSFALTIVYLAVTIGYLASRGLLTEEHVATEPEPTTSNDAVERK